jgi:signal transduction histidine kinase
MARATRAAIRTGTDLPLQPISHFTAIGAVNAALLLGALVALLVACFFAISAEPLLEAIAGGLGGILLVVAIARLASARRVDLTTNTHLRAMEARRADQVSLLSHEIRTPLAVIQGATELLAEQAPGPLSPKQVVFVDRILANATRMQSLAEQLLTQARLESGVFEVRTVNVDLRALMRDIVEELGNVAGTPIVLHTPGAPLRAMVDPQLIRQVVNNLVMNAARSDPNSNHVEVRMVSGEGQAMISVSDLGTGMTEKQRERLFQRFSSGRPLGNGTGIGLFISQQLVELHGGRIFVDTITGKGTTVMFTLPVRGRPRA